MENGSKCYRCGNDVTYAKIYNIEGEDPAVVKLVCKKCYETLKKSKSFQFQTEFFTLE